jgi:lysophospholipase L1-like esterase
MNEDHQHQHHNHHQHHDHPHGFDPYTVLIYGDSNTWGFDPDCSHRSPTQRFAYHDRWTTKCQQLLGSKFNVIANGLNGRTTIFPDVAPPPADGEYDCNGRQALATALHMQKPLDVVVIGLGANDLKAKFKASPHDIISGVRILIRDVQKHSYIGTMPRSLSTSQDRKACSAGLHTIQPPHILILGPPILKPTPLNRLWGFEDDIETRSRKLIGLLSVVCKEMKVSFLNLGPVAHTSSLDGVHFPASEQPKIAAAVASKIKEIAEHRK